MSRACSASGRRRCRCASKWLIKTFLHITSISTLNLMAALSLCLSVCVEQTLPTPGQNARNMLPVDVAAPSLRAQEAGVWMHMLKSKIVSISIMQETHYTYVHTHTMCVLCALAFCASIPSKRFPPRVFRPLSNNSLIKHANVAHFSFAQQLYMQWSPCLTDQQNTHSYTKCASATTTLHVWKEFPFFWPRACDAKTCVSKDIISNMTSWPKRRSRSGRGSWHNDRSPQKVMLPPQNLHTPKCYMNLCVAHLSHKEETLFCGTGLVFHPGMPNLCKISR